MKILKKIRDRLSGKALMRDICLDDDGLVIVPHEGPAARVLWTSVQEVFAFKQDLFSFDLICIGLRIDGTGRSVWVGEDDGGFEECRREIERRFTGIPSDWFAKIVHPPFQENRTTLWQRP